jgi:S1-C subfamily serine protease
MDLRARLAARLIAAALAATACAWAGPTPPQRAPAEPISLGESGSKLIEFDSVIVRLSPSAKIGDSWVRGRHSGEVRWNSSVTRTQEFNVLMTDELRARGYRVSEPADRLFATGDGKRTRYRLGGILRGIAVNRFYSTAYSKNGEAEASVEIEFQLYDSLDDRVLFARQFSGYATEQGTEPNPIGKAVLDALRYMLSDREFIALASPDDGAAAHASADSLAVPPCVPSASISLPEGLGRVLDSVVHIRVPTGSGTAVIVSPEGYALTSAHLVSGLEIVQVRLHSGLELDARVVRVDSAQDVALIRLPGRRFACARVEAGPLPVVGADVFAVGSPLGKSLEWSVSRGIVSGLREFDGRSFVQTDVSVNPGNSGGPLFDREARVVGVVSFKISGVGIEGLSFGVPISAAQKTLGLRFD